MPLYEYQCTCKNEREVLLPFQDTRPQICECGNVMRRKMSLYAFTFKACGRQMALDTLNDNKNGIPNRWWKSSAEKTAASGL